MTAPDALAVLKRADHRWATKRADDPNPTAYLQHLAAALTPLLQPGTAAVDLDHATELDQLRTELDATRLELEKTRLTEEGRRRDLTDTRTLLGQLVDTINEEWLPDGDLDAQVDRAVQLVAAAAHDQLQQRHDNGEHIHTYQRTPTGRHKPCPCGKPFPGKQPTRQTKKGAA